MKTLLNDCFSPIPLDEKRGKDGRLIRGSRKTKIRGTSFEDALLIIWSYLSNLCFLKIGVKVYKDDYIRKNRDNLDGDNPSIHTPNTNNADNPDLCTSDINGANNPDIYIPNLDKDRKVNNSSIDRQPKGDG